MVEELLMNDEVISHVLNRYPKTQWPHLIRVFTLYGIKMFNQCSNFATMSLDDLKRMTATCSPMEYFIKEVEDIKRTLHKLDKRMLNMSDIPLQDSRKQKVKSMNRNSHGIQTVLTNRHQTKENNFITERGRYNEPDQHRLFTERRREESTNKPTLEKPLLEVYKKGGHKVHSRTPSDYNQAPQFDVYEKEKNKLRRTEALAISERKDNHKEMNEMYLDKRGVVEEDRLFYNRKDRLHDIYKAAASSTYTYTRCDNKRRQNRECEFTLGGTEYIYDPIN